MIREKPFYLIFILFSVITSCNKTAVYKVEIVKSDGNSIKSILTDAKNDTDAFKAAISTYWIDKLTSQHLNNPTKIVAEPYSFRVYKYDKKDSVQLFFDSALALQLANPVIENVKQFMKKQFELADSINKKGNPDIY